MSDRRKFFLLEGPGSDVLSMENPWYWQARERWICSGCSTVKPGTGAVDIPIQEKRIIDRPLSFIGATGLGVALTSFLVELGWEDSKQSLYIGKLLRDDNKTTFEDWVCFHGRNRLLIRGEKNAHFRLCKSCDRFTYSALTYSYLYPSPPEGIDIFDADVGQLVVTERIVNRINVANWPDLAIIELPVLDKPLDGFDELVSPIATRDQIFKYKQRHDSNLA